MATPLFALIDCNNFFVSCERVFNPGLEGEPVVVLSSNDGCVVARSNEARAIGVPMGAPAFKHKELFHREKVIQFSANFELYGDMSRRITEILTSITPRLEVYSIDESFLDISQLDIPDYSTWGKQVRESILKWTGIPTRVGIAPTKTLAKLASELTKSDPDRRGVRLIATDDGQDLRTCLSQTPIESVWGIGWALAPKLRAMGFNTAQDIALLSPAAARQCFGSVHGERLARELNGQSCLPLERIHQETKSISVTRTFGADTNEVHIVESALANFTAKAAARMRRQDFTTQRMSIFATTSRHKPGYKHWKLERKLDEPILDTGKLINEALSMFGELYEPRTMYHRGGVTLSSLRPDGALQTDLLGYVHPQEVTKARARLKAVDSLNKRFQKNVVRYATEDLSTSWQPLRRLHSPHYTTSWQDLPKVVVN